MGAFVSTFCVVLYAAFPSSGTQIGFLFMAERQTSFIFSLCVCVCVLLFLSEICPSTRN